MENQFSDLFSTMSSQLRGHPSSDAQKKENLSPFSSSPLSSHSALSGDNLSISFFKNENHSIRNLSNTDLNDDGEVQIVDVEGPKPEGGKVSSRIQTKKESKKSNKNLIFIAVVVGIALLLAIGMFKIMQSKDDISKTVKAPEQKAPLTSKPQVEKTKQVEGSEDKKPCCAGKKKAEQGSGDKGSCCSGNKTSEKGSGDKGSCCSGNKTSEKGSGDKGSCCSKENKKGENSNGTN